MKDLAKELPNLKRYLSSEFDDDAMLAILNENTNKSNKVLRYMGLDTSLLYDVVSEYLRHVSLNHNISNSKKIKLPFFL